MRFPLVNKAVIPVSDKVLEDLRLVVANRTSICYKNCEEVIVPSIYISKIIGRVLTVHHVNVSSCQDCVIHYEAM